MPGSSTRVGSGFGGNQRLRSSRQRAALYLSAIAAAAAVAVPSAAQAKLLSAADGQVSAFSGVDGTLSTVSARYAADTKAFAATYSGAGGGGVARAGFNVNWKQRQTVAYGAAFYLPVGFHSANQGHQVLLRWTSSPGDGGVSTQNGIVIDYSTNRASLVATTISGSSVTQRALTGQFKLPIGHWFTLQVRQLLGVGSSAYSEVYVNGKLVVSSRAPNYAGTPVNHVQYGIVQLSGGAEQGQVSLEFDRAVAAAYTGYVNPFGGDKYRTGRTDMGVDLCLTRGEPIRAVGDGVVVGVSPNWFEGEPYIWYQLLDGPKAGRYVYVAEQINRLAHVGAQISAGQPVAYYKSYGTCIETGWSASDGATLAQATTGYYEGEITVAGVSFARFLRSLHVHGPFELHPSHTTRIRATRAAADPRHPPARP